MVGPLTSSLDSLDVDYFSDINQDPRITKEQDSIVNQNPLKYQIQLSISGSLPCNLNLLNFFFIHS
jgi:hypothetical protein